LDVRLRKRTSNGRDCHASVVFIQDGRTARETISRHESLALSDRDREVFFDALVNAPEPNARLRRAFQSAEERIAS